MKLRTLAIAVAMASVPFAAQADVTLSGDVTVKYGDNGAKYFNNDGTELKLTVSEKVGGLTIGGTATANMNSTGSTLTADDVNVYVSGGFGKVTMGDTDNGCDTVDTGWVAPDNFISHQSGGCKGGDVHNITYTRALGAATMAASFSPEAAGGTDIFAVGIAGKMGPATVSLGYETGDGIHADDSNVVLGISGAFGPVSVGVRANKLGDADTDVGYTAAYSAGGNNIYGGIGDVGGNDSTFLGFSRKIGKNTLFVIEHATNDAMTAEVPFAAATPTSFQVDYVAPAAIEDHTVIGLIHSF